LIDSCTYQRIHTSETVGTFDEMEVLSNLCLTARKYTNPNAITNKSFNEGFYFSKIFNTKNWIIHKNPETGTNTSFRRECLSVKF